MEVENYHNNMLFNLEDLADVEKKWDALLYFSFSAAAQLSNACFRYHPIDAATAKKNYDEYINDYNYDYNDYEDVSSPTKDIIIVEEDTTKR